MNRNNTTFSLQPTELAHTSPLSFAFADSMPAQAWSPPSPATLYELAADPMQEALALDTMEGSWATTERMGL